MCEVLSIAAFDNLRCFLVFDGFFLFGDQFTLSSNEIGDLIKCRFSISLVFLCREFQTSIIKNKPQQSHFKMCFFISVILSKSWGSFINDATQFYTPTSLHFFVQWCQYLCHKILDPLCTLMLWRHLYWRNVIWNHWSKTRPTKMWLTWIFLMAFAMRNISPRSSFAMSMILPDVLKASTLCVKCCTKKLLRLR